MPARHPPLAGTLAELAECGRTVYVVCNGCGRFIVAPLFQFAQRVGWRAFARDIGGRLRCVECRHLGARITLERPQVGRAICPRCGRPYR